MKKFIVHHRIEEFGESLMIMEENGKGYVRLYYYNDDIHSTYIEGLSVDVEFRRMGIATAIINVCERVSLENGADKMYLFVKPNTWVYDWYKRIGYVETGITREDGDVWMSKNLLSSKESFDVIFKRFKSHILWRQKI
jgi:GNAT superfamily N-acetyltransferase